jgi:Protein of unknown function (DUF2911)
MTRKVGLSMLMLGLMLLAASSFGAQQTAQQNKVIIGGGNPNDRASTRLLYFTFEGGALGQFAFNYGRPVWKSEYDDPAKFDALTKGKVWRMGSNFWSNLYTDLPLTISGKDVVPGFYLLGLQRSADGSSWSLAFIDPVNARKHHFDALFMDGVPVEFTAPMHLEPPSTEAVEKLTLTLTHPKDDLYNATLTLAWGHVVLTAPIKVTQAQ